MSEALYSSESYEIIGCIFSVFNELGYGYQEKYYYRAIKNRLLAKNFDVEEQLYTPLISDSKSIGGYYLDFKIISLAFTQAFDSVSPLDKYI